MADLQDFTPKTIGNKSAQNGGAPKERSQVIGKKSAGLSGALDNQTAAKLDSNEAKAPETMGTQVGRVSVDGRVFFVGPDLMDALYVYH